MMNERQFSCDELCYLSRYEENEDYAQEIRKLKKGNRCNC